TMKKVFLGLVLGGAALAWGCRSGGGTDDAGTDSGNPGNDSGTTDGAPGKDSGLPDAAGDAAAPVNGCVNFTDFTADGGTITFPTGAAPAQYSPNCVAIKVHQSVTWTGSFTSHPLVPKGGSTPTPITATSTGTTATFTFDNAGTYGYGCQIHPSMQGAVEVTP
ncbi:MAG TPA: plastocyanin/azurin family copper-binding protein, partial [Polyangiaceae bacterium]|nr:plastocyanin/azurin family copper-binding protein [Polyangiaceae bacterium]